MNSSQKSTMRQSAWNDENQHWIPQFLLRGFGIQHKASSLYEMDKQTYAVTERKVGDIASKTHLLTKGDDDRLRKVEDAAAKAVNIARKKNDAEIKNMSFGEAMDRFGALHSLTEALEPINPHAGANAHGSRAVVVGAFVAIVKETMEQNGQIIDEQNFRTYLDDLLDHEVLSLDGFYPHPHSRWKPHIHIAPEGEYVVIGDSPVITIRSTDEIPLQRILPISSKRVVTFTYDLARGSTRILGDPNSLPVISHLSSDTVRSLNAHYFHRTSSHCIYGRNASILKQSAFQPREWAIGESTNADYNPKLMLKLIATVARHPYRDMDMTKTVGHLQIWDFISRSRQIRMELSRR